MTFTNQPLEVANEAFFSYDYFNHPLGHLFLRNFRSHLDNNKCIRSKYSRPKLLPTISVFYLLLFKKICIKFN